MVGVGAPGLGPKLGVDLASSFSSWSSWDHWGVPSPGVAAICSSLPSGPLILGWWQREGEAGGRRFRLGVLLPAGPLL